MKKAPEELLVPKRFIGDAGGVISLLRLDLRIRYSTLNHSIANSLPCVTTYGIA